MMNRLFRRGKATPQEDSIKANNLKVIKVLTDELKGLQDIVIGLSKSTELIKEDLDLITTRVEAMKVKKLIYKDLELQELEGVTIIIDGGRE